MKEQLLLTLPKTCSQNWDSFTPSAGGHFCGSCNKVVVDFTKMSDGEIFGFFNNRTEGTCGRFRPDQLKGYSHVDAVNINAGLGLFKAGLLSLLLALISKPSCGQTANEKPKSEVTEHRSHPEKPTITGESELIVRGVVKSKEDDESLPGVNVWLKGSTEGTVTDNRGFFEFPRRLVTGDVLVFSFIGFVSAEYKVRDNTNDVIEIRMDLYYDIMGEVAVDNIYAENKSGLRQWWRKVKGLF